MHSKPSIPEYGTSALIYDHVALNAVESTNEEAKKLAIAGAPAGTIVTAVSQRSGRGRVGRKWTSPPGNLYTSLVLRPRRPLSEVGSLSLVAALAIGHTLGNLLSYVDNWQLKWPNDVLVDGAKISGVLAESEINEAGQLAWVVIGMGINVEITPEIADRPVTSLKKQGLEVTVDVVFRKLQENFRALYEVWERDGFEGVKLDWVSHAQGLGCPVYMHLAKTVITGNFVDLGSDGAIIIEDKEGTRHRVLAGDVMLAH